MPDSLRADDARPARIRRASLKIGESLRTMRVLQRLTAEQVADRAGIWRGTLRRLESGEAGVGLDVLLGVARTLGLLDDLERAVDPMLSPFGRGRALDSLPKRVRQ